MNPLKIILLFIVSLFISSSVLAAGKHALLIAIQDYSKTIQDDSKAPFKSLKGPFNDLNLTEGVLRERFGFVNDDFIIIKDATHTGIEKAFKALIERVQSDDFVYIHYSGHGSQTADLNGDEERGKDQTWVSYGARTGRDGIDNYDVLDDEINAWLAELYKKTKQVVFVSDSCHSATVSRAVERNEVLIRSVKEDTQPHILGKFIYIQPTTPHGIRVGAARDDESAIDKQREDGQHYGLFTWHWIQNLQQAQASDTWNDVFNRTYAQVTASRGIAQQPYMQQPQIEGERDRLVRENGFTPLPPRIPVYRVHEEKVKILVGSSAGVTKDSVYRLYKPQHPNPQNLPSLTIKEVRAFDSFGEPEPEGTFQTGDLVIEESHAYSFSCIKVYLEADFPDGKDKALLQAIQSAFQPKPDGTQSFPAYCLTDKPSHAELRLYLLRPKLENGQLVREKPNDALPKSFAEQPPELWILTPEQLLLYKNLRIRFDDPTKGVKLLQDNLNKLARIRELKKLQSPPGNTLPVTLQTFILSPDNACQKGDNCVWLPESDDSFRWYRKSGPYSLQEMNGRKLNKDDFLTFSLDNKSEQDYYCYLINLTPSGAIYSIFPPVWERMEYARLNAGQKRELVEEVILPMREVGENIIKVITNKSPIDVSLLEQSPFVDGGLKGNLNPLEQLLVNVVYGQRGRASTQDEWATEQIRVEVE
jgi:hypothetical protein